MRVAVVRGNRADDLLRHLSSQDAIDRGVRIAKRDRDVLIPLRRDPAVTLESFDAHIEDIEHLAVRAVPRSPRERMTDRGRAVGIPEDSFPRGWTRIGDVVVVQLSTDAHARASDIGRIVGEALGARTVVEAVSGIHGPYRIPDVRVLWGDGTETAHKEGGIRYGLDVGQVMFSPGNLAERLGIAARIRPGQVVVDLFAGIGYFTLPIAVRSRPACVYACEVNPIAYGYLLANVRRNRATNVIPLLGDCRATAPPGVADWVLMGHFSAPEYLDVAFRALGAAGTIVVHHLTPRGRFPEDAVERIRVAANEAGFDLRGSRARRVKSYAPGIVHGVVEATAERKAKRT